MQSSMNAVTDYFQSFFSKHARNVQQHEEWHDRVDDLPYPRMVTNLGRDLSELGDAEKKFLADGDPRDYLNKVSVLLRLYQGINKSQSKLKPDSQVQEDIPKPFDTPGISQRMRDYLSLIEAENDAFDKLRLGEYKHQKDDKAFPKEKLDKLEKMYNAIAEKLHDVRTDLGRELVNARGGVAYVAPARQATSGPNAEQPSPPQQAPSNPVAGQPKPSRGSSSSVPQTQNAEAHYIFVSQEGKRAPVAGPYASNEDLEADFPRVLAEMGKKYPGSVGSLMSRAKVTDPAVREKIDTHIQRVFPAGARSRNREENGGEASNMEKAFGHRRHHAQTMFDTSRANSVVPLSRFVPPPKDKRSTTKVLHRMLRAKYGMYPRRSPLVAHHSAGGRLRIVNGHAMYWAARKLGLWALPVRVVRSRGLRFRAKASARDRD
jgi:hypothetical protein